MPRYHSLVLDIATAPIADAAVYLEGTVKAPSNYKNPEAIAAYIREEEAKRLEMAATDVDLARLSGIGLWPRREAEADISGTRVMLCRDEEQERAALRILAECLDPWVQVVTFGGFAFDLPVLMRRARYLGVSFPVLNLDRYKSPHVDVREVLSDRDKSRRRSLQFYAKRLGMGLSKTLQGAEEARVHETGKWAELEASIRHDVEATRRLAEWVGVLQAEAVSA